MKVHEEKIYGYCIRDCLLSPNIHFFPYPFNFAVNMAVELMTFHDSCTARFVYMTEF